MKTLLQDYFDEKMAGYNPPSSKRAGGLSEQKYKATLLFLTNKLQENIAKEVGVSFGLLRKWRTEKKFLDTITEHCKGFCWAFLLALKTNDLKTMKDLNKYNRALIHEIILILFRDSHKSVVDARLYLTTNFYKAMTEYLSKNEFSHEFKLVENIMNFMTCFSLKEDISNLQIADVDKQKLLSSVNFLINSLKIEF